MAQFRSSAREGSFAENQLNVPSATDKIQREAQRQLSGMDRAQQFQKENQRIFLQAQQQAQGLQKDFDAASRRVGQDNYEASAKYADRAYKNQLLKKQNEDKYKIDTFGALANFSKTAYDITAGIVKENKELQQKAINEVSNRLQLTQKDALLAKSVDSSISAQQWQESEVFQDLIKQGRSQEYVNLFYEHLVKGGGYKNYINNSIVLDETGRAHAAVALEQVQKDIADGLPADQITARLNATLAKQRGSITVEGETPSTLFQQKGYNKHIDRVRDRAETLVNKVKTGAVIQEAKIQRTNAVKDALNTNGVAGAMALLKTKSSPGAVREVVSILVKQNLTADQLEIIKKNPIEINGQITTLEAFPEAYALVEQAEKELRQQTVEQIALEEAVKQAEVDAAGEEFYQEKFADGVYTELEHQEWVAFKDNMYSNRDRSGDKLNKGRTINNVTRAAAKEKLDGYLKNGTLSESILDEMLLPKELDDQYRNNAKRLDQIRASGEFKGARKYYYERIIGVIGQSKKLTLIDGGKQSDQVEWYANAKVNRAIKDYQAAVLAGVENPLEVVGNNLADKIATELKSPGFVVDFNIVPYQKTMREGAPEALKAQRMVTRLAGKTNKEKSNPNTWVEIVGTKGLQLASKELAEKGNSEVLRILGSNSHPPLTAYEVQEKIAEVSPDIEPVEIPTFMEMYKSLPAEIRNRLAGDTATHEAKLRAANEALQIFQQQTQPLPVRSTFQQSGESYQSDGSAVINRAGNNDPQNLAVAGANLINALKDQDYYDLAYAVASEAELGTDDEKGVAANILTRVLVGGFGNNIRDIINAPGQYEGVLSGASAKKDPSVIQAIAEDLKSDEGKLKLLEFIKRLDGRAFFKGQALLGNRVASEDPMFSEKGNFYHR